MQPAISIQFPSGRLANAGCMHIGVLWRPKFKNPGIPRLGGCRWFGVQVGARAAFLSVARSRVREPVSLAHDLVFARVHWSVAQQRRAAADWTLPQGHSANHFTVSERAGDFSAGRAIGRHRTSRRIRPAFSGFFQLWGIRHFSVSLGVDCRRIGWPQRSPNLNPQHVIARTVF